MSDLPAPLVAADLDVRDLDGFMLNVERLMASELVALSSHEVIAGALFLWCRAWKQLPAASLPDDDRVIAAFAKMPIARFRKLKTNVLRGFIKCSDGRLYHRTLAGEAIAAYARKKVFIERRGKDAERLKQWRLKQDRNSSQTRDEARNETGIETNYETDAETRFVREGRDDTVRDSKERKDAPPLRDDPPGTGSSEVTDPPTPEAELFRRGREILGSSAGGLVRRLLTSKSDNVALARATIETASTKGDPREYLGAVISNSGQSSRDMGGSRSSRDM